MLPGDFSSISFSQFVPEELVQILLALALSFLIGLQREEKKVQKSDHYAFGGVRTFPIIGLLGFLLAKLSEGNPITLGLGFVTLGSFLWLYFPFTKRVISVALVPGIVAPKEELLISYDTPTATLLMSSFTIGINASLYLTNPPRLNIKLLGNAIGVLCHVIKPPPINS